MTIHQSPQPYNAPGDLFKLQKDLERATDTNLLVSILFEALSERLDICGIRYDNPAMHIHIELGSSAIHSCAYHLKQNRKEFGSITTFQTHQLSEVTLSRLEAIIGLFIQPLQDSLLYQQVMTLHHWDPVTRVNNKTAFKRALNTQRQNRRESDHKLNALFMHLTNLRDIYAAYGSDNADTLLCQIIQNIREHCRDQDNIFRFSEDKFVVLLSNTSPEEAERISHRLADICNTEEQQINGTKINCKIDIELVECGSEESCSACDHIDQQHCISQPNKR